MLDDNPSGSTWPVRLVIFWPDRFLARLMRQTFTNSVKDNLTRLDLRKQSFLAVKSSCKLVSYSSIAVASEVMRTFLESDTNLLNLLPSLRECDSREIVSSKLVPLLVLASLQ